MWLLVIGLLLLVLKLAGLGPLADWSWWVVAAPFGMAVLWWTFSDSSGLTARREMDRWQARRRERKKQAARELGAGVSASTRRGRSGDPTKED